MTPIRFSAILVLAAMTALSAQGQSAVPRPKSKSRPPAAPAPAKAQAPQPLPRWKFNGGVTFAGDSNINHDQPTVRDYGAVPFLGVQYDNNGRGSRLRFEYDVGLHRYARTTQWNRVSQYARGSWKPHWKGRWSPETLVEATIKGSSEDRDLSNRYTLRQELGYELAKGRDLTFYAAYRRRHYPEPQQNSDNPYGGFELEQKLGADRSLSAGARWELNAAQDTRYRYRRMTLESGYEFPVHRRGRLEISARYKPAWYTDRTISSDSTVLRRDQRWIFDAAYEHRLRGDFSTTLGYEYETRSSNETDKRYNAHLLTVTFRRGL